MNGDNSGMSTEPKNTPKSPHQMSTAELEEAHRIHREMANKLLEEIKARREAEKKEKKKD